MKAGISNIWLLGIIAIFIFIFSAYVIISVNYTKSFKLKNEVLSIIERGQGFTGTTKKAEDMGTPANSRIYTGRTVTANAATFQTINLYLLGNAYDAKGTCPDEPGQTQCWYGVTSLDKFEFDYPARADTKYYYCFAKFHKGNVSLDNRYTKYYYRVRLFYKVEIVSLLRFLAVKVDGKTADIIDVKDKAADGSSILHVCKE